MNTGAFGENFPYSNFHDLNTDWIIKIAKDFLDQYTHIQEVIANGEQSLQNLTTEGLEQLQNKADALEALLQQWYDTHSEDIANQLADALGDIQTTLQTAISNFNTSAELKAAQTIASIPDDYSSVAESVRDIENALHYSVSLDYTLVPNTFINYSHGGAVPYTDPTFFATDAIRVMAGMKISIMNYRPSGVGADYAGMAFYDIGMHYISGVQYRPPAETLTVTVPQNAVFMKCSYFSDVNKDLIIIQSNYNAFNIGLITKHDIIGTTPTAPYDNANTLPAGEIITYVRGYYPSNIPTTPPDPTSRACTIITLNYNKKIFGGRLQIFTDRRRFCVRMADNESAYGAWMSLCNDIGFAVNSATTFIAPLDNANTLPVDASVCYIGPDYKPANSPDGMGNISLFRTYNYAQYAFGGRLQIATDRQNMWFRMAYSETEYQPWVLLTNGNNAIHTETAFPLFESVGVIGDSYASGTLTLSSYSGNDHYPISWPQIIARKCGISVTNFSAGGLTTRSWLTDSHGLSLLQSQTAKDLYVCTLGINDNSTLGTDYLGTISDIDTEADTFYGNYGKIIKAIQTKAPNGKIVLSTMAPSAPGAHVPEFNTAIIAIAEHFGIPCMIQGNDPFFTSSQYTSNIRYNHPMAGGYMHMANAFDRMLCKVMDENVNYFANYGLTK